MTETAPGVAPRGRGGHMPKERDFGPVQLAGWLGLSPREVRRAQGLGLIPGPDVGGERWSVGLARELPDRVEEIRAALAAPAGPRAGGDPAGTGPGAPPGRSRSPRDREARGFGPVRLARRIGLGHWQVSCGLAGGLIPPADLEGGRWSEALAGELAGRAAEIRAAVGDHPWMGSVRAAARLAARTGLPVERADVRALAERDLLRAAGEFRGHPMYAAESLDALAGEVVAAAVRERLSWVEASVTAAEGAALLGWPPGRFEVTAERRGVTPRADGRYPREEALRLAEPPV